MFCNWYRFSFILVVVLSNFLVGIFQKIRRRLKDDIKMGLKGIKLEGVDWIHMTQVRDK